METLFFKGVTQGGTDVHHACESYISDFLGIPKSLHNSSPGIVLPTDIKELIKLNLGFDPANQLKAIHKGMANGGIGGFLQSAIPVGNANLTRTEILQRLKLVYANPAKPELHNMWPAVREWLLDLKAKGHLLDTNGGSLSIP